MSDPTYAIARLAQKSSYLILVQSALVALDISLAIGDAQPQAKILIAKDAVGASRALSGVSRVHVAFLELDPQTDIGRRLTRAVRSRGGRIVLLGDAAEDLGPGPDWTVLVRPFTTACVLAVLAGRSHPRPSRTKRGAAPDLLPQRTGIATSDHLADGARP